jgi:hypothetical protein
MVLYWFFYSLLNQMSSDSPGDPYQKEHKLVDKCIEKQQVHPDVVQPEIIAGSYRPLIFLFIGCSCIYLSFCFNFNHCVFIYRKKPFFKTFWAKYSISVIRNSIIFFWYTKCICV